MLQPKQFGVKLRELRKAKKLTQGKLGEEIGVTKFLVSKWETGQRQPSAEMVWAMLEIFGGQFSMPEEACQWVLLTGYELEQAEVIRIVLPKILANLRPPDIPPAGYPQLPATYIHRQEIEEPLIQQFQAEQKLSVLVLTGPGGIGKSTLARWLAEQLAKQCPDGIIWVDCQPDEKILDIQSRIAIQLQVSLTAYPSFNPTILLRSLLRQKKYLLILDDLWVEPDLALQELQISNSNSPMIATTRNKDVPLMLNADQALEVPPLSPAESKNFLQKRNGNLDGPKIDQIVERLGGHPLALTLVAHQMQWGCYTPDELLTDLQDEQDSLRLSSGATPQSRETSLRVCLDLSYQRLPTPTIRQQFAMLGCFRGAFQPEVVQCIWQADPKQVKQTLNQLIVRSLLTKDKENHYRLHPLLADYARYKLSETTRSELAYHTFYRYTVYYIRHYLYHPQVVDNHDTEESAPNLDTVWPEIVAGVKWAATHHPKLAAIAILLAHTERPALLEAVGAALLEANRRYFNTLTDTPLRDPDGAVAILLELRADLQLLHQANQTALLYFKAAEKQWLNKAGNRLAAGRIKLRIAGIAILHEDWPQAAKMANEAQTLLEEALPLKPKQWPEAERLFYYFENVYNILVRWADLPETDVIHLVQVAARIDHPLLKASSLRIHRLYCTANLANLPAGIEPKVRQLASQAANMLRENGRPDKADSEIFWTEYALTGNMPPEEAEKFARRASQSSPLIQSPPQLELIKMESKGLYWWLTASEKQRVAWLSRMLPHFYQAKDRGSRPKHFYKRAREWVEQIFKIGMLGQSGRRLRLTQAPAHATLSRPAQLVFTGEKIWPLVGEAAQLLVEDFLNILDKHL